MTREQAQDAIDAVAAYLREQSGGRVPDSDDAYFADEPQWSEDAARWSRLLLRASGRDTLCGCPLCRS